MLDKISQPLLVRVEMDSSYPFNKKQKRLVKKFILDTLRLLQKQWDDCFFVLPLDFVKIIGIPEGIIFSKGNLNFNILMIFDFRRACEKPVEQHIRMDRDYSAIAVVNVREANILFVNIEDETLTGSMFVLPESMSTIGRSL